MYEQTLYKVLTDHIKPKIINKKNRYNKWVKCRDIECENVQPNIRKIKKKTQVLCANSIALIKIIK